MQWLLLIMGFFQWAQILTLYLILVFWGVCCIVFVAFCQNIMRREVDLLHDNASSHRSTLIIAFLAKIAFYWWSFLTFAWPGPCDFYLFGRLHLPMKDMSSADISMSGRRVPTFSEPYRLEILIWNAIKSWSQCIEAEVDTFVYESTVFCWNYLLN